MQGLSKNDIQTLKDMAVWFRANRFNMVRQPPTKVSQIVSTVKVKIGKADSAITADSTGTISIYEWDGSTLSDTGDNIEDVRLDWMHGNEDISSGKEVLIMWFPAEKIWRIIGAECE